MDKQSENIIQAGEPRQISASPTPHSPSPIVLIGSVAAAIVIILGVLTFALNNNRGSKGVVAGMKNYSNEQEKYTLEYPSDWTIDETSGGENVTYLITPRRKKQLDENPKAAGLRWFNVQVRTYDNVAKLPKNEQDKLTFEQWVLQKTNDPAFDLKDRSAIKIAGVDGFQWTGRKLGQLVIMFEKNGRIYRLETGEIPTLEQQRIIDRFALIP